MASNPRKRAVPLSAPASQRQSRSRAHARDRLREADDRLAEVLPLRQVDEMSAIAEDIARSAAEAATYGSEPRTSSLTGELLPSLNEMAPIRRRNLLRAFAVRRALLEDALTVAEVAELLGVGRQTPHDRVKAQTLLAVKENGRLVFPEWQFDPDGPDGVIPGLPDVLAAMRGPISALARVRWFLTPKALMGGVRPLDALRAGAVEDVISEAETIGIS
jgi:hypothetical protein